MKKLNIWFFTLGLLTVIFVSAQLFILSTVGTNGQQLSDIRGQQNELKVENEILKAQILELRSNKVVLEGLSEDKTLQQKNIVFLNPDELNISAMD